MSLVALGMALIDAVKSGDREAVGMLLDGGVDPNTVDLLDGLTALQLAQRGGHAEIAGLLRQKGAIAAESSPPEADEETSQAREALLAQIVGPGGAIAACLGASGTAVAGQVATMAKQGHGK